MPGFIYRWEGLTPLLSMSPIVDTHTGFHVQLSIHIRIKIKKEDIVYPLVDIDSIFQKVLCLPN